MKIITNNQPRPTLSWWDLSDKEKAEFDWLEAEEEQCSAVFFKYKRQMYCLDEFFSIYPKGVISGWDGIHSESAFSGVLVNHTQGINDEIIVGRYYN